MKERKISVIFKLLVISSLLIGILLNLYDATSVVAILSYYTLQSNIICLFVFVTIIIAIFFKKYYRSSEIYYLIKGGIVIAILITAITYQIALAPNGFKMDFSYTLTTNKYLANLFVHFISPILVFMDYILFDVKGNFKWYYPFIWLITPFNYVIYVYTYSSKGGRFYGIGGSREFAYIFLDYNQIGYSGVAKAIMAIIVMILGVSYLIVFLDKRWKMTSKKSNQVE